MDKNIHSMKSVEYGGALAAVALLLVGIAPEAAQALTVNVVDGAGQPVAGFRYLVETDTTWPVVPGQPSAGTLGFQVHTSYSPVAASGRSATAQAQIALEPGRYYLSVLPVGAYTLSGQPVEVGAVDTGAVTVVVNPNPIKTAQISVLTFHDHAPMNAAPDQPAEEPLAGFKVIVFDLLGHQMADAFGNPIGSIYLPDGSLDLPGHGYVLTDLDGQALVKNLAPGKYGVRVIPPAGQDWVQTSTIEGTPGVDTWVQSGEPPYLTEWGLLSWHAFFGFVHPKVFPPARGTAGTITGRVSYVHEQHPPLQPGSVSGRPVPQPWVALNDLDNADEQVYTQPTAPDGTFAIDDVPPGTYQLVLFDRQLDMIIDFRTVVVPLAGGLVDLGDTSGFAWFGNLEGSVFHDADQDGFRDPGEIGISDQAINLRFPDGSMYQTTTTDMDGQYSLTEIFPFFHWMIAEVDYTRFKATGATVTVDDGGALEPGAVTAPQPQPENGGQGFRTEQGPSLLEGILLYGGATHVIDWGKAAYANGENGGITGIAHYASTRAEADPRFAAADDWEPGIPRVQFALYQDDDEDGLVDDVDGNGLAELADRDNEPLGWFEGGPRGPEDVDRDDDGTFDPGDALNVVHADSWDDATPSGCVGTAGTWHGQPVADCAETLRTYNQVRPAVFDGGYAFWSHFPGGMAEGVEVPGLPAGTYIVEASTPPGYEIVKEEDKNVDFGEEYQPESMALPPVCVGDDHLVPDALTLFPGVEAPFAGLTRPLCDRKQVEVRTGKNAAADFFLFTETPKAGRVWGMALNDVVLEFDPTSPQAGGNLAVAWIPIAFKDFAGHEVARTYTDEMGRYNALLPSTYTANVPAPSGYSPNMLTVCLNDPGPIPDPSAPSQTMPDPAYNPTYGQVCQSFDFMPGRTTSLDTPILPIAAFSANPNAVDCELPNGTPGIYSVSYGANGGPRVPSTGGTLTIRSIGTVTLANPDRDAANPASPTTIQRDYGFGAVPGSAKVGTTPLQILSWDADGRTITAKVPSGTPSGQLTVTRGDNQSATRVGVTVWVGEPFVVKQASATIQATVDAAPVGSVVLVPPGVYRENVILWKKVRLQGFGAGSTILDAGTSPTAQAAWDQKLDALLADGSIELVPGERPDFFLERYAGVMVAARTGAFTSFRAARIDGFTIRGAQQGGAIFANGFARYLTVSNNRLISNSGSLGGGIRVGTPSLLNDAGDAYNGSRNDHVTIRNNLIAYNGAIDGGGGVALFNGSDSYRVEKNRVCANYSNLYGGGIAHFGLSRNGYIVGNEIVSNQSFDEGGGLMLAGELVPAGAPAGTLTPGTGTIYVQDNLIQGNLAGDDGGGIRVLMANGADVAASPNDSRTWHLLRIDQNIIVNNSSADAGGGISFDDAARVYLYHDTIANNDSTATGPDAFGALCPVGGPVTPACPGGEAVGGLTSSVAQVAGVASRAHSEGLIAAFGTGLKQTFTAPAIRNTIVHDNRSFHWDADYNGGLGGLRPDLTAGEAPVVWDLGVTGTPTPKKMPVAYSLLTSTAGYATLSLQNVQGSPAFRASYHNTYKATSKGAALGNFVATTFTPNGVRGDYHVTAASAALEKARLVGISPDIDGQVRPNGLPDIGADEYYPPVAP